MQNVTSNKLKKVKRNEKFRMMKNHLVDDCIRGRRRDALTFQQSRHVHDLNGPIHRWRSAGRSSESVQQTDQPGQVNIETSRTPNLIIGAHLFSALSWMSIGFCLLGFSDSDCEIFVFIRSCRFSVASMQIRTVAMVGSRQLWKYGGGRFQPFLLADGRWMRN